MLAAEIKSGRIICLEGNLGSGKTTFAQGLLRELGIKGPYTSPTFLIIKNYQKKIPISPAKSGSRQGGDKSPACQSLALAGRQFPNKSQKIKSKIQNVYHVDAYRIKAKDILNLGWKEMLAEKNNIIIIEWADRIKKIIPRGAIWIKFKWLGQNKRKITFK
ncbi:MAG: hypothetical protein A2Z52_01690 [Candidatus Moranbacteria bacterium RBG_19FT_COMBO_42_6]|nr:MAG: hypothetical protein A2Z52_01690 [Candidatus Moranbacteria bacterium RBG_19FT_COMBO_42_6]